MPRRSTSADPDFQGNIFVLRDVTERKRAERRIRYLARFDMLTKMPNRMQFQHLLHQAITRSLRQSRGLVLLYLDVDNFKEVNDTFGHAAGDRVLETLSERLARALPKESVVGRLAGDEFARVRRDHRRPRSRSTSRPASLAARWCSQPSSRPLHVGEHEIEVTVSVGIALCPDDADNVIDLIRNADAAMYHAKRAGRNCHVFYAPEMNAAAVERLLLKSKLRRALERNEFVLRYQPKVDLAQRQGGGRRGAAALAPAGPRRHRAGAVHPARRGVAPDPRHRRLGAQPGVQRLRGVAEADRRPRAASRSTCRSRN